MLFLHLRKYFAKQQTMITINSYAYTVQFSLLFFSYSLIPSKLSFYLYNIISTWITDTVLDIEKKYSHGGWHGGPSRKFEDDKAILLFVVVYSRNIDVDCHEFIHDFRVTLV